MRQRYVDDWIKLLWLLLKKEIMTENMKGKDASKSKSLVNIIFN